MAEGSEAQGIGETFVEAAVELHQEHGGCDDAVELACVDRRLHGDVGSRLELEVTAPGLGDQIRPQRAFDVDGSGIVTLDEVGVVAVQSSHEITDGRGRIGGQAPGQPSSLGTQQEGEVAQLTPGTMLASRYQGQRGGARVARTHGRLRSPDKPLFVTVFLL